MRKLSLFLLLASAAVPAIAQSGDDNNDGGRHHRGNNQSEQSESRPQRVREVQQQNNGGEQRNFRVQRAQSNVDQGQQQERFQNREARQQRFEQAQQERAQNQQSIRERFQRQREQQAQSDATQTERVREWRQRDGTSGGRTNWQGGQANWQDRQRQVRTIPNTNVASGPSRSEQQLFQDRRRTEYRNGNYTRWTNNWRNDRRYDWNRYRTYHRSIFSIGFYSDPFGWNYRPWSIGSYMYPSYYDQSFWLNDPWQYRLPPAYGPYRWVRYWDDALLVNIYTGQVEDVIHNFFW